MRIYKYIDKNVRKTYSWSVTILWFYGLEKLLLEYENYLVVMVKFVSNLRLKMNKQSGNKIFYFEIFQK